MEIILAIGSFTAFVFAFVLFNKKEKQISDKILATWMIILGINLISVLFYQWSFLSLKYFWIVVSSGIYVFHFPILYVYAQSLTRYNFRLTPKLLVHSIAPLTMLISCIILFVQMDRKQLDSFSYDKYGFLWLKIYMVVFYLFIVIFYLSKTYFLIKKHQANIKNIYSYEEKINLIWIQRIVWGFVAMFVLTKITLILMLSQRLSIANSDYIMYSTLILVMLYIGYWGIKQGRIFELQPISQIQLEKKSKTENKASKTVQKNLKNELQELMESKKPFLNPQLTLYDLSKEAGISTRELSNVLNREMQMNFYEFVNRYRVAEMKERLKTDSDKFTVLAIALDCGFNSKASFNRVFKQITGFTPSEYLLHQKVKA